MQFEFLNLRIPIPMRLIPDDESKAALSEQVTNAVVAALDLTPEEKAGMEAVAKKAFEGFAWEANPPKQPIPEFDLAFPES